MISVMDLFCGAGGFSWGFKNHPYNLELAIDLNPIACKTYELNFPNTKILNADISELHSLDILKLLDNTIGLIIASPPCEPFTNANKRRQKNPLDRLLNDTIGRLVLHAIRIIGDISPKFFIIENVPQLGLPELKGYLIDEFSRVGYEKVFFNVLKAQHFGSASKRSRLFITNFEVNALTNEDSRNLPVIEVLKSLPDPSTFHCIPNHEIVPLTMEHFKKISKLKWGDSMVYYQAAKRINTNWKKLHPDQICPTILGSSRYIHPFENRILTVREQARFQGFPDDFVFYGPLDQAFNQVGEAVPPPVSDFFAIFICNEIVACKF